MRSPEMKQSLAWSITYQPYRPGPLRQTIERMLVPLKTGILPHIISASSGLRLQTQAVPVATYPLHQLAPARTRVR